MENLKILIVEDDPMIAESLRDILEALGHQVMGIAESGEEAVMELTEKEPDVLMLDIQLKGKMDGVELARLVRKKFEIPVIFTTAYADENTIARASAENPFGYLVKPYGMKDVMASLKVAMNNFQHLKKLQGDQQVTLGDNREALYLKVDSRLVKVAQSNILYVEAKGDYMLFKTQEKSYVVHSTMKNVEGKLDPERFVKVHRSFMVNLPHVSDIEDNSLVVADKVIPISRSNKDVLMSRIHTL